MAVPGKLEKQINTTLLLEKVRTILIVNMLLCGLKVTFFLVQIHTFLVLPLSIKTLESLFVIAHFLGATKSDRQKG